MKENYYKRNDGLYELKVTINGKRKSIYGHSKAEVRRKKVKLLQEVEQGRIISNNESLKSSMSRYLVDIKKCRVRPITYDRAESIFINEIVPHPISKKSYSKITVEELQKFLNELSVTYSKSTVKKVYDLLGEFYRFLKLNQYRFCSGSS